MRSWTLEQRYRVLKDKEEIKDLFESTKDSEYRQKYHIQPITGLLSDPNGFSYHDGKWHLFYQWCPWGAVHGLKYWYHVSSPDLTHWKNEGIGLSPDTIYDNKGVHSGSAFSDKDQLYLFYTGNHRDENWIRTPYTCLAILEDDKIVKLEEPLFGPREDFTEHQRDPKVIYDPEKDKYFILIGAQDEDLNGSVLVYSSDKLREGWKFEGPLKIEGFEGLGGMYECPNLASVDGKDVLFFSPQYVKIPGRGESTNHSIYLIGNMDYDNMTFIPESDYEFLDYGFDFYAAQVAGRSEEYPDPVLISWIGLPDNHYPSEEEDWEGSLTIPRKLSVKDGVLRQTPALNVESIKDEAVYRNRLPKACYIEGEVRGGDFYLDLYTKKDLSGGLKLNYNAKDRVLTVSKEALDKKFNTEIAEVLEIPFDKDLEEFEIFIDSNSIEFFFNNGVKTFTAHIYPTKEEHYFNASSNVDLSIWKIKETNTNKFKV